jgi:hypothetical protein
MTFYFKQGLLGSMLLWQVLNARGQINILPDSTSPTQDELARYRMLTAINSFCLGTLVPSPPLDLNQFLSIPF